MTCSLKYVIIAQHLIGGATIRRKIVFGILSLILILILVISTACVPKKTNNNPTSTEQLQSQVTSLQSSVASLSEQIANLKTQRQTDWQPTINQLQQEINTINSQVSNLQDKVVELETMKEEEEEETATDETTRWSLNAWTDYQSFDLLEVDLNYRKIEDDDDYTIWLLLYNKNFTTATDAAGVVTYTYEPVEIKEITVQFDPKSGDRVVVDEDQTELYSAGFPSFDWDMEFKARSDGTCKGMEAVAFTRYVLPVPSRFINDNPETPYPVEFKLEFELAYK